MTDVGQDPPAGLIWSDTILAEGEAIRRRLADRIHRAGLPGELVLSGPAAVPGVLTRGDIDLHLRVLPPSFALVVARLRTLYEPASLHAWADTLAVFAVPGERPTGLAVTPFGSEHDRRFRAAWDRFPDDAGLRAAYNALKIAWIGTDRYEDEKSAFFDRIADGRGEADGK